MESLWNETEAADCSGDLGLRAYTSRLLGSNASLVLHGGGNTSVKLGDVLVVKGTGRDLARVREPDFCRLRLQCVRDLLHRAALTNAEMIGALDHCRIDRSDPRPSIETLMHASLAYRYVEHTHADSVLAVINTEHAPRIARAVYGELAPLVPYRHSGVELADACAGTLREKGTRNSIGLLLQFHGVVAFGDTARGSYENMIRLVSLAETYLKANNAWCIPVDDPEAHPAEFAAPAHFVSTFARIAGFVPIMRRLDSLLCRALLHRADFRTLSQMGPATPQHAVYTKRVPQVGWDVDAYAASYARYLTRTLGDDVLQWIDPAPRIIIDPESGIYALGPDEGTVRMAADFYLHDLEVMLRASAHDRYRAAPEDEIARAELEYRPADPTNRRDSEPSRAVPAPLHRSEIS